MQQVVQPAVVPDHAARLRLDRDPALALDVELVQHLLVPAGGDGARDLEQAVAERALAVVDVRDDAEAAEARDGDRGDAPALGERPGRGLLRGREREARGAAKKNPDGAGSRATARSVERRRPRGQLGDGRW